MNAGVSFILSMTFHVVLLGVLAINVSLDKPQRPEDKPGKIMQATIVNMPPAKGSPSGKPAEEKKVSAEDAAADAAKKAAEEIQRKQEELAKQVEEQKAAEDARKEAIALKKKAEEEARLKAEEEAKKKAEEAKKKAEAEAKKKAEEEARKKAEEEAKRKAAEEAKKKAEEEKRKAEAKKKAEEEAKRKAEEEAKRKAEQEALKKAQQEAAAQKSAEAARAAEALEDELLGTAEGVDGGVGLGSGDGSDERLAYGNKVQMLIEQNWRIDPSMNNKKVVVTVTVDNSGMIVSKKCDGDRAVCASALATVNLIGMMPMPPAGCSDCNTIVITMIPKI